MDTELIGALEDRAATYGLISRLFGREADESLLAELDRLPWGAAGDEALDEGGRLVRAYLDGRGPDARTELAVDFARLFVVRTAKTKDAPYPYESVHTSEERITMADARDQVRAIYREEGLEAGAALHVPEDHIALELEFEQKMCLRAIDALRAGDDGEARRLLVRSQEFLREHLLSWTAPFFDAMERTARTGFYQGLAGFTAGFLADDARFLEDLLP